MTRAKHSLIPSFDLSGLQHARPLLARGAAVMAIALLVPGAGAALPGSIDPTFDPTAGGTRPGLTGESPYIQAVAPQPNGTILVGGWFNGINGSLRENLARLLPDGSVDPSFHPGAGPNGAIDDIAVQTDGRILVIGGFQTIDTQPRTLIARLNANGAVDPTFHCTLAGDANLRLTSLAVQSDGRIWIGGMFTNVNGVSRHNLARLHPDGSLDLSFDPRPVHPGTNHFIAQLVLQSDQKLLVAGAWTEPSRSVLRLNSDGTLDPTFASLVVGDGIDFYRLGQIKDVAVNASGTIAIAGNFDSVNGVPRHHVARLQSNGALDTGFDAGSGPNYNFLWAVSVRPDGKVVIGGNFSGVNGVPRAGIAQLNQNGSVDSGFDPGAAASVADGYYAGIRTLALQSDGRVLVGASAWWEAGSTNTLFRLGESGARDYSLTTLVEAPIGRLSHLVQQPDGSVLASSSYGYPPLWRLLPNGLIDQAFSPEISAGTIYALASQPDGKILVALAPADSFQPATIVRLLPDGRIDDSFHAPSFSFGEAPIEVMAVQPDGRILVGGLVGIVRLHSDGSSDDSFLPVPITATDDPGYGVEHILVLPDGRILIAGGFGWESGESTGIALLEADGAVVPGFGSQLAPVLYVTSVARQYDGKFVVGLLSWQTGPAVIRLNSDGTTDPSFRVALPIEAPAIVAQPDGRILVSVGYYDQPRIMRLEADGSEDSSFQVPVGPWSASRMLLQPDGQLLIAGGFHYVAGTPTHVIARLNNDVRSRLDVVRVATGESRLSLSGLPGARWIIDASANLNAWVQVEEIVTAAEPVVFVDTAADQFTHRFYRARQP